MNHEIWQQLLSLESMDLCREWFLKIHGRELNARRATEINSAAKQAREYFTNANAANNSVRPLLTFYGVASLSRSLLLLLRRDGGEETLAGGHGLHTVDWSQQLSGDPAKGLALLPQLKIQTCSGLFSDFIESTRNRISIHASTSAVDWHVEYPIPAGSREFTLGDLLVRLPDLAKDFQNISAEKRYASINELTFDPTNGFRAKILSRDFASFQSTYQQMGYTVEPADKVTILAGSVETFSNNIPQFIHSYVHKMFGSIPTLHIADPFGEKKVTYSQLGITYLMAYFLGMLVRYYPTHWITLVQGGNGDALWPSINRAQHLVEETFPELVIEMVYDILNKSGDKA